MYKYYPKNNWNIMYYYFDSIFSFLNYLDSHETSPGFSKFSSLESMKTNKNEWSGTSSLKEAMALAKYGYSEDFDRFASLKLKLERFIKLSTKKNKQYNDYIGYVPNVKAYLEGSPLSMFNKKIPPRKQIDIYFNTAYSWQTATEQIFNCGAITLCIAEILEKLGFSVNLNIFDMSYRGNQVHYVVFNLKNTAERLHIKKLYFPMCHNSWLRRLLFRLLEETPNITSSWHNGYGYPADNNLIREIIDLKANDIVIPQPSEIGIKGEDLIEDAGIMFDFINKNRKSEDFELQKVKRKQSFQINIHK